ncbi:MAG TPA: FAD-dependent oxidoreductase [Casimicrobiaceae bacterium]|nr:FAD-dependent oxidoreductase [Casimicrobiaceae bacterium]
MIYGNSATELRPQDALHIVALTDRTTVPGRAVVIATGVSYRTLDVPNLQRFHGAGVFYGAAMSEAPGPDEQHASVIGGGNFAGQAAIHLAKFAKQVTILVRRDCLAASMSDYLITEINATPNIDVRYRIEVIGGGGNARLERLTLRDHAEDRDETMDAAGLFIFIGAKPFTEWLPAAIDRDEWGYITTGPSDTNPHRLPYETTSRLLASRRLPRGATFQRRSKRMPERLIDYLRRAALAVTASEVTLGREIQRRRVSRPDSR